MNPREWTLDRTGWMLPGAGETHDLHETGEAENWERVLYKERWARAGDGFEQRYVATFSFRHMEHRTSIREQQAERAAAKGAKAAERRSPNDPARFLSVEHVTADGELAECAVVSLDGAKLAGKARYFTGRPGTPRQPRVPARGTRQLGGNSRNRRTSVIYLHFILV